MDGVYRAARRAGDQRFSMEPHNVRRRDCVPGLPAPLLIAFAGSTSIAWAQAAPVVPRRRREPRLRLSRNPPIP